MTDAPRDDLVKLRAFLDWAIRKPNSQLRYSRCKVCDSSWGDREEHRSDCLLLGAREAADALSRPNIGADIELLDEVARLRKELAEAGNDAATVVVPRELLEAFVTEEGADQHSLDRLRAILAAAQDRETQGPSGATPAESASVLVPSDDVILALAYKNFASDVARKQLLRTVWKDSINIDEPNYYLKCFVKDMLAAAQGGGK